MRIPRLYTPQSLKLNQELWLEEHTAHHVATVLRIKKGREVVLFNDQTFNGKRGEFRGVIKDIQRKKVSIICHEFTEKNTQSPVHIALGACLIKNDRFDWLIQKATELGVNELTPLWSDNTDIKIPNERLEKKQAHWQQIMINACEQSGRTDLVTLHPPQNIESYITNCHSDLKVILHPATKTTNDTFTSVNTIDLLVGPEGGFSETEVERAEAEGFKTRVLGSRILRAETAPLAFISVLQYQYGDW